MSSSEIKTDGLVRIIHNDGSFRNQMIYNRAAKSVATIIISDEYDSLDDYRNLIKTLNEIVTVNNVFIERTQYYTHLGLVNRTGGAIYCYSEIDAMAIKLLLL